MTPDALIASARTWLGVLYRHQGRSRVGVDCAGFIICLGAENHLMPPRFRDVRRYGRAPSAELIAAIEAICRPADSAVPASLVVIQWPGAPAPSHVALCTGPNLIQCYGAAGRVVEAGYRGPWLERTHSLWLLPGIDYP